MMDRPFVHSQGGKVQVGGLEISDGKSNTIGCHIPIQGVYLVIGLPREADRCNNQASGQGCVLDKKERPEKTEETPPPGLGRWVAPR